MEKTCEFCDSLVEAGSRKCPDCGAPYSARVFIKKETKRMKYQLSNSSPRVITLERVKRIARLHLASVVLSPKKR